MLLLTIRLLAEHMQTILLPVKKSGLMKNSLKKANNLKLKAEAWL